MPQIVRGAVFTERFLQKSEAEPFKRSELEEEAWKKEKNWLSKLAQSSFVPTPNRLYQATELSSSFSSCSPATSVPSPSSSSASSRERPSASSVQNGDLRPHGAPLRLRHRPHLRLRGESERIITGRKAQKWLKKWPGGREISPHVQH